MEVDCQTCGWRLEVPPGIAEGGEFACGRCGMLLRNVASTREFRWSAVDPFLRRRGATRVGFWLGAIAGAAWIPAFGVSLLLRDKLDPAFLAALALPWIAIEAWLARRRARIPSARWYVFLWIGVGAFVSYAAVLVAVVPPWRPLLGIGENPDALRLIFTFGILALMVGAAGASLYRWVLSRTPTARATPPAGDP